MHKISLSPTPSQSFDVVCDGYQMRISLLTRGEDEHLYLSLECNGVTIQHGALCVDKQPIISRVNEAFAGVNLHLVDLEGDEQPNWKGLGSRFVLLFMTDDEYEALNG